jgi:EmrB/QacA subfamily drug resistance transporter
MSPAEASPAGTAKNSELPHQGGTSPHADPHYRQRWLILVTVCLAQLMILIDATVINVALPSAQQALHFSNANREWVITAYVLAFGSLLPLGGRLADLLGQKAMFLGGATGFGAMSAVAGAAPNFPTLLIARTFQGIFAAMLAPAALSVIPTTFTDPKESNRAFAVYGAIAGSGGAIGLVLGGVLTTYESWRWTMYVNVIFAVIAAGGALALMTNSRNPRKPRLDFLGTALVSGGLFLVVFGAAKAETNGWTADITLASLAAGGLLLIAFLVSQRYIKDPLMPLSVLADRNRGAGYLALALATIGVFSSILFLNYYFQRGLGWSPVRTGVAYLPAPVALIITAAITQEKLIKIFTTRLIVIAGLLIAGVGLAVFTLAGVQGDYWGVEFPGLVLQGVGVGSALVVSIAMGASGTAPEDAGAASAMNSVSQQIGSAVGIAVLSTFAATATAAYFAQHPTIPQAAAAANVHGYQTAFWWGAGIIWAAAVICGLLIRPKTRMNAASPEQIDEAVEGGLVP